MEILLFGIYDGSCLLKMTFLVKVNVKKALTTSVFSAPFCYLAPFMPDSLQPLATNVIVFMA